MTTTNLGRVGFVLKGNWVSGTYKRLDVVRYSSASWGCQSPTTTGTPGVSADWVKLTDDGGAGLGGNTFTGDQNLSDNHLLRAMIKDCGYTVCDLGNSGTGTVTYDYTAGSVQTCTANGNHTIAFSNFPPAGNLGEILVQLTNGGAHTITWPTINWLKPDGTTTTSVATYLAANTGRTALQSSGMDQFLFWTRDAGTTVYGKLV